MPREYMIGEHIRVTDHRQTIKEILEERLHGPFTDAEKRLMTLNAAPNPFVLPNTELDEIDFAGPLSEYDLETSIRTDLPGDPVK